MIFLDSGETGPASDLKAYDFLVQAESGLVDISGGPNELGRIGVSICDIGAGMTAHAAIVEALFYRERTGEGYGVKRVFIWCSIRLDECALLQYKYGGKSLEGWVNASLYSTLCSLLC